MYIHTVHPTHVSQMFQHFAVLGSCRGGVPVKGAAFAMKPRRSEFLGDRASGAHLTSHKHDESALLCFTPRCTREMAGNISSQQLSPADKSICSNQTACSGRCQHVQTLRGLLSTNEQRARGLQSSTVLSAPSRLLLSKSNTGANLGLTATGRVVHNGDKRDQRPILGPCGRKQRTKRHKP